MRLTVGAKIFAGFLVVLTTFVAVSIYALWHLARIGERLRANQTYVRLALAMSDLDKTQRELVRVVRTPGERTTYWRKGRLLALGEATALARQSKRSDLATRLSELEQEAMGSEPLLSLVEQGDAQAREKAEKREERLAHAVRTLRLDVHELVERVATEVEREESNLIWAALLLVLLATLCGAAVTFAAHATLRPLARLTRQAYAVGRGDYTQRIEFNTSDEIGELARAFNSMAAALHEREQELILSERLAATGKIAAQITHEVRNPLSSIGLNVELLEEEIGSSPNAHRLLAAIVREVDRLTEITEEYLRFARLRQPKLEREDLSSIVRSLVEFSEEECARYGVSIEQTIEAAPALADENQMRQVLLNLLRNAREAMPKGGKLRVRSGVEQGWAWIRIGDSGPGIAPEHRSRIFEPFYSTKEGGTGLGLAIAHQIVKQHGGTIDVETQLGQGTTFSIRLPLALEQPVQTRRESQS